MGIEEDDVEAIRPVFQCEEQLIEGKKGRKEARRGQSRIETVTIAKVQSVI